MAEKKQIKKTLTKKDLKLKIRNNHIEEYHEKGFVVWCGRQIVLNRETGKKEWSGKTGFTDFDLDSCTFEWEPNSPTVCINTGEKSGIIVFDFDVMEEYDRFISDHPELKDVWKTKTRRGYHLYFKYREGFTSTDNTLFSYKNVDIKTNGGLVYAAPTTYTLLDGTEFTYESLPGDIIDCPDFLLDEYNKKKASKSSKPVKNAAQNLTLEEVLTLENAHQQNDIPEKINTTIQVTNASDKDLIKYYEEIIDDGLLDEHSDGHGDWIKLGLAFKYFGDYSLFDRFSKRSTKYTTSTACMKTWNSLKPQNKTMGSVVDAARNSTKYAGSRLEKRDIKKAEYQRKQDEKEQKKKEKEIKKEQTKKEAEEEKLQRFNTSDYNEVKTKFELRHAKIDTMFIKKINIDGDVTFEIKTRTDLLIAYEDMKYTEKDGTKKDFIIKWLKDENKRTYERIDYYPNIEKCPADVYNSWETFKMEAVPTFEYKEKEVQVILKHIQVLCGNEEQVFNYFCGWLGHAIKYPEIKIGTAPVFISKQGCGKGEFILLLKEMLGQKKVMETSTPDRDLWGSYTGDIAGAYIVNINEFEKKHLVEAKGQLKTLITDPTICVNNKFEKQHTKKSYHRFIFTTNKSEPMNTTEDDRRFFFIKSSDEFVGNAEYHAYFRKIIQDVNVQKSFYEYLKNMEGLEDFHLRKAPETSHHKELKEMSKTVEERFLEHLCTLEGKSVKYTVPELMAELNAFVRDHNINNYKIDAYTLGSRLNMLMATLEKDPGEKGTILIPGRTNKGVTKEFNLVKLRKKLDPTSFADD